MNKGPEVYLDYDQDIKINEHWDATRKIERYLWNSFNQTTNGNIPSQPPLPQQYITIGTHNVNNLTEEFTHRSILDFIYPNFTILGLSETKLTTLNDLFIITKQDSYILYWASSKLMHNGRV